MSAYAWTIETTLQREAVRDLLAPFRPFRIAASFSNGFSTTEFDDRVAYGVTEPLAKLHYFQEFVPASPGLRVLDVGSHLGHYGHHFLARGAAQYVGVEYDRRTFQAAQLLAGIAGLDPGRYGFHNLDFGARHLEGVFTGLGTFDLVLSLAVINNIRSLTLALERHAAAVAPEGMLVLEYLAVDSEAELCLFHPTGYGGDASLCWTPSQAFLVSFLAKSGLRLERTALRWRNPDVIGAHRLKVMDIFRRSGTA